VGLPPETYAAVISGEKKQFSTKRNPRKDRYFLAKVPRQARITALGTGLAILRDIVRVEGTATEWHIYI